MEPTEILRATKAKILKPERWTTGHFARSAAGVPVDEDSSVAFCWCALGALYTVAPEYDDARHVAKTALHNAFGGSITAGNDRSTHAKVLATFDLAIASLEASR